MKMKVNPFRTKLVEKLTDPIADASGNVSYFFEYEASDHEEWTELAAVFDMFKVNSIKVTWYANDPTNTGLRGLVAQHDPEDIQGTLSAIDLDAIISEERLPKAINNANKNIVLKVDILKKEWYIMGTESTTKGSQVQISLAGKRLKVSAAAGFILVEWDITFK